MPTPTPSAPASVAPVANVAVRTGAIQPVGLSGTADHARQRNRNLGDSGIGRRADSPIVQIRPEGGKAGSGKTKTPKAKETSVSFPKAEVAMTYTV